MSRPTDLSRPAAPGDVREVVVVDASVIVSLLIDPGPAGASIASRLGSATLIAPALLPFEVANVLRRRRNAGLLSPGEAALAHDDLLTLPIELWPWETLAPAPGSSATISAATPPATLHWPN